MDPDGTIFFLINFIISVLVCLYIADTRQGEEIDEFEIGVSKNFVSAVLVYIANLGIMATIVMPLLSLQIKCVCWALFVLLGSFVPYCVGLAQHENLGAVKKILSPLITVLNYTAALLITLPVTAVFRIFKLKTSTEATQEDVMDLVEDVSEDIIDDEQKEMIENIFELGELTVDDIMTHRTEVFAVSQSDSCREVIEKVKTEGFSRIPVYSETVDTITGILYVKDLLGVIDSDEKLDMPVSTLARAAMFVPKSCLADDLLVQFKMKHTQLAVVVDEYGGTSGIVTMEDILEEIVGNIQDEYDNEEEEYHKIDDNTYIFKASIDIEEAFEVLGMADAAENMEDEDYDTVGGMIINKLARIPTADEKAAVEFMGVRFTVMEVADRRIVKVRAEKLPQEEE